MFVLCVCVFVFVFSVFQVFVNVLVSFLFSFFLLNHGTQLKILVTIKSSREYNNNKSN